VGLAGHVSSPLVHEGLLFTIALVLVGSCLVAAQLLRRRAPAVSLALASAVFVGTIAFFVSSAHDRHGVPQDVGVWASVGLCAGGFVGLIVTRPAPSLVPIWRAGVACLALSPFGAALLFLSVVEACPPYVTHRAGFCYYGFDMLGGWATGLTILFAVDVVVVAVLFFISGAVAKRRAGIRLGEDEWARL